MSGVPKGTQLNTGRTWIKKGQRIGIKTEFKKGEISAFAGRKHNEESKLKMKLANLGKVHQATIEASKKRTGEKHQSWVKRIEQECKLCHRIFNKRETDSKEFCNKKCWYGYSSKNLTGNNHHSWQGGKSFEPYPVDWTRTLRRSIRERDYYTCQLCKEPQGDEVLSIHHIDYNKTNCNPENLISLCRQCHTKTNHKRQYWINYFKQIKTQQWQLQ